MENNKFEFSPCVNCKIKEGYGGDYRCSLCEVSWLKKENKRLNKKVENVITSAKIKEKYLHVKLKQQAVKEFIEKFLQIYTSSDGLSKDPLMLMVNLLKDFVGERK